MTALSAAAAPLRTRRDFLRLLSSAVVSQALLSAASLVVSLLLIRQASADQYGAYVLVASAILLLVSLQGAFFNPAMVIRMAPADVAGRRDIVGGLHREHLRMLRPAALCALLAIGALLGAGWIDGAMAFLLVLGVAAAWTSLTRAFYRIALLAYRRAEGVLRGDVLYVLLLVAGAIVATRLPHSGAGVVGAMALAGLAGGAWLSAHLRRHEPWNAGGAPRILGEVAPDAMWSTGGASVHWLFSQGYLYLVAVALDVHAVAALAATRLLLAPVNVLSTGVGSLMLPVTAGWLRDHSVGVVFRRLLTFAAALATGAACYVAAMWWARDWVFAEVLRQQFAQRDLLLALWSVALIVMVLRDQLLHLLVARGRFRPLTTMTAASAVAALAATFWGVQYFGVPGALVGVITGELLSTLGIVALSARELRAAAGPRAPV